MSGTQSPIVVGVDDSPATESALRWAVEEALTRRADLRLIGAYSWVVAYGRSPMYSEFPETDPEQPRYVAERVIAEAITQVAALDPTVAVHGQAIDGDPRRVLIEESARAALLVLGSRQRHALGSSLLGSVSAGVAARASCPTVVLRGPTAPPSQNSSVIVGVDGTDAAQVLLEFAFDHASRHHRPLRVVWCWRPDLVASKMWRAEPTEPEPLEMWLSEVLAGWREKHPDVDVHGAVVHDRPVAGLVAESASQHLLVVGSRGHNALAGTLLGSVSQGVLHHASCPVAIVPTHVG